MFQGLRIEEVEYCNVEQSSIQVHTTITQ